MTISTQDCKDFIISISSIINTDENHQWKRIKKYKENNLILRDFENQYGRTLTIAEYNSKLFLYHLSPSNESFEPTQFNENIKGRCYLNKTATEQDVFSFMSKCVQNDSAIIEEDNEDIIIEAKNPSSWTVWIKWSKFTKVSNNYDNYPLADFFYNNDGSWREYDLYYPDENGNTLIINKEDIVQVFWTGLYDYGTAYRIYVFETYDHQLWLGCNNPD